MPYFESEKEFKSIYDKVLADPLLSKKNVEYIEEHISYLQSRGSNVRTLIKHLYHIRRFYRVLKDPKKDFKQLTREDIQYAMANLEGLNQYSPETKRNVRAIIKFFWKHFLGKDEVYPEQVRWLKTSQDRRNRKLPEELLTEDEILRMIEASNSLRNKAIIALLYDSGCRVGELLNLRKKDIDLESNPAHIVFDGKTGMRKIPIMFSVPYLAVYLNLIKDKEQTAFLWTSYNNGHDTNRKADYSGISKMLKETAEKAHINKRIYAHLFRHSRATSYANKISEQRLKMYFGWTPDSQMASVYVHLSGRDLDDAILEANGEKPIHKTTDTKLKAKICPRCRLSNSLDNTYCSRCGSPFIIDEVVLAKDTANEIFSEYMKDPIILKRIAEIEYKRRTKRK